MEWIYILLAVVAIMLVYMRFEASWVQVRRVKFTDEPEGLKVLHLSDIHTDRLKVPVDRVRRIIEQEKPDVIVMTGDYIEQEKDTDCFYDFLERTVNGYPVFACLGNHDYKAFKENRQGLADLKAGISARGVRILQNQTVCFEKGTKKYNIIGIGDLHWGHPDVEKAAKGRCVDATATLCLSHNPDIVLRFPPSYTDYFFCGHFHGGQIWAPFSLEFKLLRKDKLCKSGISRGLHDMNGVRMYISRGLGNVCLPMRLFSRPEITVYHMP